jgi:hypothetical protein
MRYTNKFFMFLIVTLFILPVLIRAQEHLHPDLEKAIQNPIANLVSLPFQDNTDFDIGTFNRTKNTLNINPVLPFTLGKSVNLITRTIIPIITQPVGADESTTGLSDINLSLLFTPAKPGAFIWGLGPVIAFPTATDDILGTGKWSTGPGIVILTQPEGWTFGMLAQNIWSFAGNKDRKEVNFFYSQVFITKHLPAGWYVNTGPIITSNWKASSGNQWTVPLGMGAGKLFKLGKLPVSFTAGYYYYVEKPEGAAKWMLRAQLSFILPKFY